MICPACSVPPSSPGKIRAIWLALAFLALACGHGNADEPVDPKIAAFRAQCAAKAAAADKAETMTVAGKDGWLFLAAELRHLSVGPFWGEEAAKVSKADRPDRADPLPAILDFKAQLGKAGVELILLPVPAKASIYPEMIFDGPNDQTLRFDSADENFYKLLGKAGVTAVDLTTLFRSHRGDKRGPVFCKQDTHWSGYGCELCAGHLAHLIGGRDWLKPLPKLKLDGESRVIEIDGDLRQALTGEKPPAEKLTLRFVGTRGADGSLKPVEIDHDSPILLLGDSHTLVFHSGQDMLAEGAGLADQLALELGIAVDLIGVRGSGATPARVNFLREVRKDPKYLAKKKLVIWCFTAREFTEGTGWAKVPIVK